MHLALLIPVYNEERTLAQSVQRVLDTPLPPSVTRRTLVIVDDGSQDATAAILHALRTPNPQTLHTIRHERNAGKGAAVRTALTAALELGADILLIHDADLEYDPADHARVLAPILDGRADAVIGSRFLGDTHRVLYFWHSVANRAITTLSNVFTNLNLTDIECCTKAFTRQVALKLTLAEDRFGIEPELIARLARVELAPPLPGAGHALGSDTHESRKSRSAEGNPLAESKQEVGFSSGLSTKSPSANTQRAIRIYEVAVSYAGRTYAEGKKITWKDGLAALWCILKHNLSG